MEETSENMNFLEKYRIDSSFPCVTERYFKPRIIPENDQCILVHSNRLCLISIAPTHQIFSKNLEIESVDFETVARKNRLNNKVSGKFKRGGQKLKEKSIICVVKTCDGQEYIIYSCVCGTLVEVNEKLIEEPNLLRDKPWSDGYIAIILPPFPSTDKGANTNIVE